MAVGAITRCYRRFIAGNRQTIVENDREPKMTNQFLYRRNFIQNVQEYKRIDTAKDGHGKDTKICKARLVCNFDDSIK